MGITPNRMTSTNNSRTSEDDLPSNSARPSSPQKQKKKKLPWNQLLVLAVCRLADPITLSSVFPYLPEMIESFSVPPEKISFWAGITSAVFSLSQAVTGVIWGKASDRFGRKPVIMCGMICIMLSSLLFGFSRSLAWAIVARCFQGASNGNVGIMRTAVAEMVREKDLQPTAFAIMPVVWQIGCTLGPVIGGLLANPSRNLPALFGKNSFLKSYPFALPNLVSAVFLCIGLIAGFLFLKETMDSRKHQRDIGLRLGDKLILLCSGRRKFRKIIALDSEESASLLKHTPTHSIDSADQTSTSFTQPRAPVKVKSTYREIFTPQSNLNLLVYTLLALHSIAYDQLLPVFMHYPQQNDRSSNPNVRLPFKFGGGFGIDSGLIGIHFMTIALLGMGTQFLVFPYCCRRFGVLKCFKVISLIFPLAYVVTPFTVLLPGRISQECGIFAIMIVKWTASIFAFPCSTILLTNSASSLAILGTLNGVAVSISALGRAAGPFIAGWAFTEGAETGYAILPWWILAALALVGAAPIWWLTEGKGFGGDGDEEDDGDGTKDQSADDHNGEIMRRQGRMTPYTDDEIEYADMPPPYPPSRR